MLSHAACRTQIVASPSALTSRVDQPGTYVAGFWKLFKKHLCTYILNTGRTPGTPQIGQEMRPRTPQISSNIPRESLIVEAGLGDRLATLRVSKAKR